MYLKASCQQLTYQLQRKDICIPRSYFSRSLSSSTSSHTCQHSSCLAYGKEFSNHTDNIFNVPRNGLFSYRYSSASDMLTRQEWLNSSNEENRSLVQEKCQNRNTLNNEGMHYDRNVLYGDKVSFRNGTKNSVNESSISNSARLKRRHSFSIDEYKCHFSCNEALSRDNSDYNTYGNS